jgi:hypothetical protein
MNEIDVGALLLGSDISSTSMEVPAESMKTSLLQIELVPENPISPASIGNSPDKRLLGIGLKSMQLKEENSLLPFCPVPQHHAHFKQLPRKCFGGDLWDRPTSWLVSKRSAGSWTEEA